MSTEERELRRAVLATRRRRGLWIAATLGVAAHVAAVTMLGRERAKPPPPEVLVIAGPAVPIEVPSPPPPPVVITVPAPAPVVVGDRFGDLGPCPEVIDHAPRGAIEELYLRVDDVTSAPRDARKIAAWTDDAVLASLDGGRTFERVLDGPGQVLDVAYDCHGRLMAYRAGGWLGVRADTHERWVELPGLADTPAEPDDPRPPEVHVLGGGPYPAVLGTGDDGTWDVRVAIALDGEHWQFHDLGYGELDGLDGVTLPDGTVRVVSPWVDCMSEGMELFTIDPARGTVVSESLGWVGYDDHPVNAAAVFGFPDEDDGVPLSAWRGGKWRPIVSGYARDDDREGPYPTLIAGTRPILWDGARVFTLTSRRAKLVTSSWPEDAPPPRDVDAAGRVWGVDDSGTLIRRP